MTDVKKREITVGSIVQISPDYKGKCFAGCLLTVTEVKGFGVQGYIQGVGKSFDDMGGQYYLRPTWDDIEPTWGISPWIIGRGEDDDA